MGAPHRRRYPRFIPAGAGNTRYTSDIFSYQTVYPRWRGEHVIFGNLAAAKTGLSPLARGTLINTSLTPSPLRFIPAGAGNTYSVLSARYFKSVYPRWRGEHACSVSAVGYMDGLSPLARGTPLCTNDAPKPRRFIPAGAGNTHYDFNGIPFWYGLSPLARGTPLPTLL